MGDDLYNPFTAETYVKRVPFWKVIAYETFLFAIAIAFAGVIVWWIAVLVFSLEKI